VRGLLPAFSAVLQNEADRRKRCRTFYKTKPTGESAAAPFTKRSRQAKSSAAPFTKQSRQAGAVCRTLLQNEADRRKRRRNSRIAPARNACRARPVSVSLLLRPNDCTGFGKSNFDFGGFVANSGNKGRIFLSLGFEPCGFRPIFATLRFASAFRTGETARCRILFCRGAGSRRSRPAVD